MNAVQRVRNARNYPVHECLINQSWQNKGLVTILLSRKQPDYNIVFGVYLVDIFCLGLKNTYCNADFSSSEYERNVKGKIAQQEFLVDCPISLAHQIIYGAIDYASKLGFKPQKDFKLSRYLLERRDRFGEHTSIEFGKDGKPFYMAGPDDNGQLILKKLQTYAGEGNFHYMVEIDR